MNAIHGRSNKPDLIQAGRKAQTPSQQASVRRRRPLPCYKEPLAEPRWEQLAVLLRVTPARVPLPERQWEGWLAASVVATNGYDKRIKKLMQRRHPVLAGTHTCERCRPVCRAAVTLSIDGYW